MALNEEDLKFKLTIDPDTAKMQAAIKDIGKEIDDQAAKAKAAWADLGISGTAQMEAIRDRQKTSAGFERLGQAGTKQLDQTRGIQTALPGTKAENAAVNVQPAAAAGGITEGITDAIAGVGALGGVLEGLGVAIGAVVAGVVAAIASLNKFVDTIASFVAVASPGVFQQWQLVLQDIAGVIGQSLTPVLIVLRDAFRFFGDVLATLIPTASETSDMLNIVRESFKEFAATIKEVLDEMGPELRFAVKIVFGMMIAGFDLLVKIANAFVLIVTRILGLVNSILGVDFSGLLGDLKSSVGAAAQPARFTSVEEFQKSFQQAALSSSENQDLSVPEQQLDTLQSIEEILQDIRDQKDQPGQPGFVEAAGKGLASYADELTDDPFGIRRALLGF